MRLQHTLLLLTTAFTVVRAEIVAYEDCDENAGPPGDATVQGIKWGIPFSFNMDNPQICGDVRPSCPLQSGQWYTYNKTIFISTWYPAVYATVRWRLKNTNGDSMVCVEVPVELA
ncbi:NPC intracellular cholesterol transporter 2 a [Clonorchis sinensis]|uniref:NPC intracellular cholesterol transporter 2 a n=1 Tax=Clonorchis sinensis TaxID=79923 RepID=A0A8T1MAY3_CLOSI|nr:NPC intracellular cholesterol transporter 2 a [Clonorchis sinensis]